jgi:hypothetical protein
MIAVESPEMEPYIFCNLLVFDVFRRFLACFFLAFSSSFPESEYTLASKHMNRFLDCVCSEEGGVGRRALRREFHAFLHAEK